MESEDKSTDGYMGSLRLHHIFCSNVYDKCSRLCMRTEPIKYRHINIRSVFFILLLNLLTSLHEKNVHDFIRTRNTFSNEKLVSCAIFLIDLITEQTHLIVLTIYFKLPYLRFKSIKF